MKFVWNATFEAIFWGWNLIFLIFVYFGIMPWITVPLFQATLRGDIPVEFSLTLVTLIAIPTVSSIIGGKFFIKKPLQLIRLFYGVEAPLFLLCLLRLFVIRELTPASTQILSTIGICIAAFGGELFFGYASRRKSILQWAQMSAHSLMLIFGIYAGVILLFYALPLSAFLVQEFVKFEWLKDLWDALTHGYWFSGFWFLSLYLILFAFSATLFIFMPSALAAMYINSGSRILQAFARDYGIKKALAGASAVLIAFVITFVSLQQQPQVLAFSLLANAPNNERSRQTILAKSNQIRDGLVNAYLSSYRYLSSRKDNNHVSAMYKWIGLDKSAANNIQNSYNLLMSPFLYQGSEKDVKKAEKLYADFFDTPLQKAEKVAVTHAVQSTFNQQEVKAGLLNINDKKVLLASQQVTVKEHGDWADVELYEVYKNQTSEVQEVFYSFSLPESAVITGLWLGDTNKLSQRFPFTVSPRGAAQKVYNSQVRRERPVDPALLEQVGPRHYRLRAFPIPPKNVQQIPEQPPRATEMHLWLTYKVMGKEQGWKMPNLGERRNIFWSQDTKRIRNGKGFNLKQDAWLEEFIPASDKIQPGLHEVNLENGEHRIVIKPLSPKDYSLPKSQRIALVLDTSRSMGSHIKELSQTWNWLKQQGFADKNLANNDADLYVTVSKGAAPKRLNDIQEFTAEKTTFYGTIQPQEMLSQFNQLRGDTAYDAVLLVSDEGSYELSRNNKTIVASPAPLWIVHLGGLPAAYNDGIIKSIQDTGGGVSEDIAEVLGRIATKSALGDAVVNVVDNYAWYLQKNDAADVNKPQQPGNLQPLAARQLILGLSKQIKLDNIKSLDAIHAIAKKYAIVSPYSSMLVLVNDEQRRLLKEAEAASDRFDRKIENGKETLTKPNNPFKTSIPESSSGWMLIVSAAALFILAKRPKIRE
ncbi:TIGR02921 family PEP-CTERM protein [Anabaena cylindrica UHCC 0172]|uniref:TIGR02921 family PEP-CTERM protein n=1 Tax=Anabaena cylindrica TaxID=1165 RepID=UPI002B210302|nr:TIGR02921 family PEP-CTERM protein [Anabaena cylindrica]MEA5553544.1 TIGR02921 family PEP-CTERM protein [Anabaena cylindrica UHCC 0172]